VEERKAKAMVIAGRLKLELTIPLDMFINNKNFDALAQYRKSIEKEQVITEVTGGAQDGTHSLP